MDYDFHSVVNTIHHQLHSHIVHINYLCQIANRLKPFPGIFTLRGREQVFSDSVGVLQTLSRPSVSHEALLWDFRGNPNSDSRERSTGHVDFLISRTTKENRQQRQQRQQPQHLKTPLFFSRKETSLQRWLSSR